MNIPKPIIVPTPGIHQTQKIENICVSKTEISDRKSENFFFDRANVFKIGNTCTGQTVFYSNQLVIKTWVGSTIIISLFLFLAIILAYTTEKLINKI